MPHHATSMPSLNSTRAIGCVIISATSWPSITGGSLQEPSFTSNTMTKSDTGRDFHWMPERAVTAHGAATLPCPFCRLFLLLFCFGVFFFGRMEKARFCLSRSKLHCRYFTCIEQNNLALGDLSGLHTDKLKDFYVQTQTSD